MTKGLELTIEPGDKDSPILTLLLATTYSQWIDSHGYGLMSPWALHDWLFTEPVLVLPRERNQSFGGLIIAMVVWSLEDGAIVWMRDARHRLTCLNTWLLTGDTVWVVMDPLGGRVSLEEAYCWGWALRVYNFVPLPVCPLLWACMCACLRACVGVISLFPALITCCHASPTIIDSPSNHKSKIKIFFCKLILIIVSPQ